MGVAVGGWLYKVIRDTICYLEIDALSELSKLERKVVCSKRKEFAPIGSKFFPFRVDPFSPSSGSKFLFR